MNLGTEEYVMIAFIGLAIGWIASAMSGRSILKNMIWALIGAALGAFALPQAGVSFNLGNPTADLAAFTALGAAFCAMAGMVLS